MGNVSQICLQISYFLQNSVNWSIDCKSVGFSPNDAHSPFFQYTEVGEMLLAGAPSNKCLDQDLFIQEMGELVESAAGTPMKLRELDVSVLIGQFIGGIAKSLNRSNFWTVPRRDLILVLKCLSEPGQSEKFAYSLNRVKQVG